MEFSVYTYGEAAAINGLFWRGRDKETARKIADAMADDIEVWIPEIDPEHPYKAKK